MGKVLLLAEAELGERGLGIWCVTNMLRRVDGVLYRDDGDKRIIPLQCLAAAAIWCEAAGGFRVLPRPA